MSFLAIKQALAQIEAILLVLLSLLSPSTDVLGGVQLGGEEVLKTTKANILDSKEFEGVVKYAYKTTAIPEVDSRFSNLSGEEIAIVPQGRIFKVGQENGKDKLKGGFFGGYPQYTNDGGVWKQVEFATTSKATFDKETANRFYDRFIGRAYKPQPGLIFGTAHAATESAFSAAGDGVVIGFADNTAWATHHDNAVAQIIDDTSASQACANIQNGTSNNFRLISRSIMPFDTTAISTSATISSSTVVFTHGSAASANNLTPAQNIDLVSKTNVGTALVAGNYASSSFGTTVFASATAATWAAASDGTKMSYLLNSDGRDLVQTQVTAGTSTTFGVRVSGDTTNTAPDYVGNQVSSNGQCYNSDQAGTASDPIIYIEFTVPSVSSPGTPPLLIYY